MGRLTKAVVEVVEQFVIAELLKDLVERGIQPEQKQLFIIDRSKALRSGGTEVFGEQPVQRCRLYKERNVTEQLPEVEQEDVREQMRSAWKLPEEQGITQLKKLATSLQKSAPSAANRLREGLHEMFTSNRLGLPHSLPRSFSSINVIVSTCNGTRRYTKNVSRWQDASMALRWAAASLIERESHFNKIAGFKLLGRLESIGSQVWTIHPEATVLEAASLLNKRKNVAMDVANEGQAIGMFTERDILQRVVVGQLEPATR